MSTFKQTHVFFAGIESAHEPVQWMASFRSAGPIHPQGLAGTLWPPQSHQKIIVWPAARFGGRHLQPTVDFHFDCPHLVNLRLASEIQAQSKGISRIMTCFFCGCWEQHACAGGCWWVASGLCSACCKKYGINPALRAQLEPEGWETAHVTAPLMTGGRS